MPETPKNGSKKPTYGKDSNFKGKAGRSGPPKGSRNALRHGLKAGKLPPNCAYIEIRMNTFRRELEDCVIAVKGEIGLIDAANIQTAMKWERHGALALRWLRLQADQLKPTEQLQFSREIAKASTERDKAIALLGLDVKREPIKLAEYVEGNGK